MEAPRMFCNPRITSRCKGFGAAPSVSKLNNLQSHYREACVVVAITGVMICLQLPQVLGFAGPVLVYFFESSEEDRCPGRKFSPQDHCSKRRDASYRKNARWNIGVSRSASQERNCWYACGTNRV